MEITSDTNQPPPPGTWEGDGDFKKISYFDAVICLILASNSPALPLHAPTTPAWGEVGGVFEARIELKQMFAFKYWINLKSSSPWTRRVARGDYYYYMQSRIIIQQCHFPSFRSLSAPRRRGRDDDYPRQSKICRTNQEALLWQKLTACGRTVPHTMSPSRQDCVAWLWYWGKDHA
jgi:hypothetical protein